MKKLLIVPMLIFCCHNSNAQSKSPLGYKILIQEEIDRMNRKESNKIFDSNRKSDATIERISKGTDATTFNNQATLNSKVDRMEKNAYYRTTDSKISIDSKLDVIDDYNRDIIFQEQKNMQAIINGLKKPKRSKNKDIATFVCIVILTATAIWAGITIGENQPTKTPI